MGDAHEIKEDDIAALVSGTYSGRQKFKTFQTGRDIICCWCDGDIGKLQQQNLFRSHLYKHPAFQGVMYKKVHQIALIVFISGSSTRI